MDAAAFPALVAVLAAAGAAAAEAPPEAPKHDAPTWQIIVPERTEFSASLTPGEAMWLPPSSRFWVTRRLDGMKPDVSGAVVAGEAFLAAGGADGGRHGDSFVFRAPSRPGAYALDWQGGHAFDLLVLTAGRMTCAKSGAGQSLSVSVGRQLLGSYPDPTAAPSERVRSFAERFLPPLWFFEFDAASEPVRLSKHVAVGDMVGFTGRGPARQKDGARHINLFPPSRLLVRKLEATVARLEAQGFAVGDGGLVLTSGFRAPAYNGKVGGSNYSRHIYGDAADILIDCDMDGRMDDLNRDGRIDREDAIIVANAAREAELAGRGAPGGIGVYECPSSDSVGAYVHVDARGYVSRWGVTYKSGKPQKLRWWPEWEFAEEEEEQ